MRRIAMMMAAVALMSAQGGAAIAAGQPATTAPSTQRIESRQGGAVQGLPLRDPRLIILSLAALTTFILGFIAAVKGRGNGGGGNGGTPVSP